MQQPNQQEKPQFRSTSPLPPNLRFRKVNIMGNTVQAFPSYFSQRVKTKQLVLDLPNPMPSKGLAHQTPLPTLKAIEQDYMKKYKAESGIKSLLKAYEDTRRKSSAQGMSKLGLDVIKIKSFSSKAKVTGQARAGLSIQAPIHSKPSINKLQLRHIVANKQILVAINHKSARQSKKSKWQQEDEHKHKNFKQVAEMATSLTNFSSETSSPQRKGKQELAMLLSTRKRDPNRRIKRQSKVEDYLYKKWQGTEKNGREQMNQVYERRIRSFVEFLWKNMWAHGIYMNLDLKPKVEEVKPRKIKAYVCLGNNGAMVRGLIKRRFWWTLSEERTSDCQFVWTQLKINEIFQSQPKATPKKPILKQSPEWQSEDEDESPSKRKGRFKLSSRQMYPTGQQSNQKLMNDSQVKLYKKYWSKYQKDKERDYAFKLEHSPKQLEVMTSENQPAIHNHLPNNFFLGNKKALFYNLRQYYSLTGRNVFHYLPLTFHIRKGTKDPEYTRFVEYYKRRAKVMQKQAKYEQQSQDRTDKKRHKTRNIWIVKPGENSNQGRGITVIDEIYELNSLIKQGKAGSEQTQRTYIVQQYIDRPMLYHNRKFDIRHYMLITNFYGVMRAYWYHQGYVRTASYEFDIDSFEPQIHLTNDAIQKKYPDYGRYQTANKVSYEQFQRYLDGKYQSKGYNFREQIIPKMKAMATDAAKSVYNKIAPNRQMNNFQIFGLDFMIDKNFEPWLIEINTNPCLEIMCPLLNKIIPYMVDSSFKLSLDLAFPPPSHYPNTCRHYAPLVQLQTFKYDLIFDSQHQGQQVNQLYSKVRGNFVQQIGDIEDDEEYGDEGKECRLEEFT